MMAERVEGSTLRLSPGSPATTQIWMMHLHPAADSQASSDDEETESQPAPAPLTLFLAKDSLNLAGIPDDQAAEKISEVDCIASKSINGLHNLQASAAYFCLVVQIGNMFGAVRKDRLSCMILKEPVKKMLTTKPKLAEYWTATQASKLRFVTLEVLGTMVQRLAKKMLVKLPANPTDIGQSLDWLQPSNSAANTVQTMEQWEVQSWMLGKGQLQNPYAAEPTGSEAANAPPDIAAVGVAVS